MSGICGFTWRDFNLGQRMASVMAYRGPRLEFPAAAHERLRREQRPDRRSGGCAAGNLPHAPQVGADAGRMP